jgi:hypothetical protein
MYVKVSKILSIPMLGMKAIIIAYFKHLKLSVLGFKIYFFTIASTFLCAIFSYLIFNFPLDQILIVSTASVISRSLLIITFEVAMREGIIKSYEIVSIKISITGLVFLLLSLLMGNIWLFIIWPIIVIWEIIKFKRKNQMKNVLV